MQDEDEIDASFKHANALSERGAAKPGSPALRCAFSRDKAGPDARSRSDFGRRQDVRPLRFYLRPGTEELHQYRISAIFESHPEMDHVVIGMIRNGFETFRDLHRAPLRAVFAGVDSTFGEQRRVIESLKAHLRLEVTY